MTHNTHYILPNTQANPIYEAHRNHPVISVRTENYAKYKPPNYIPNSDGSGAEEEGAVIYTEAVQTQSRAEVCHLRLPCVTHLGLEGEQLRREGSTSGVRTCVEKVSSLNNEPIVRVEAPILEDAITRFAQIPNPMHGVDAGTMNGAISCGLMSGPTNGRLNGVGSELGVSGPTINEEDQSIIGRNLNEVELDFNSHFLLSHEDAPRCISSALGQKSKQKFKSLKFKGMVFS
ncbi:hypothetical protein LXL04_034469 [Taraxacum kok-saghyz]